MRFLVIGCLTLTVAAYVRGAVGFYAQERWVQAPQISVLHASSGVRHPEAILGAVRGALGSGDFSNGLLSCLELGLAEVPSSYQSTLLLTVYRANRMEEPELIRRGFEAALRRFPANGRLHLTFARWLLASRPEGPDEDASQTILTARAHLEKALRLEEELVGQGLTHIRWSGTPVEEWMDLVPDSLAARRQLLQALVHFGYRDQALEFLETMVRSSSQKELLREAAAWALQWGHPSLALEAAGRWRKEELSSGAAGVQLAEATLIVMRAHLALGNPEAGHRIYLDTLEEMETRGRASRPARLSLMNGMGYEYLRRGQTVLARSAFLQAQAMAPYHVESTLGLARTYRRSGDRGSAIEQYRRVLELDGDHEEAKREVEQLLVDERPEPLDR